MAQFIAFDKNAEILGRPVLSMLNAFPAYYRADIERIMQENAIVNVTPSSWHNQQGFLNVLKEISNRYGANTLFGAGVAIGDNIPFPSEATLESVFSAWGEVHSTHYRNGYVGYIRLLSFDSSAQKAVMECKNADSCHFERGIITACLRRFKPKNAVFFDVQLDKTKPSRLDGADSSFYIITWF
ncbi:MAG: hypothetical protein WAO71_09200 [Gallionella sp.]